MMTAIALVIVAASVVLATVAAVRSRNVVAGVPLMLDLWIAAGLLRLTENTTWTKIAAAAVLIALRKVVGHGLLKSRG
jgi:hypothetical protein